MAFRNMTLMCRPLRTLRFFKQSWDVCLHVQAIEEVKEEIRLLNEGGQGALTNEQYEQKQQLLLMKWFRVTGPAKVEAGVKHVEGLLEQGKPFGQLAADILHKLNVALLDSMSERLGVLQASQTLPQALFC